MAASEAPIAIVGLAYRAPGVGRKGLWDYLVQAESAWSKMPASRFDQQAFYTPGLDKRGCFQAHGAHFLPDDIYSFDAAFFNMRAEEARNSDPQHRMMLECALEAAENAGHSLLDLAGKNIGVYVAVGSQEYAHQVAEDLLKTSAFTATGIAGCMFANRLSYFFDIHGPSVAIEAACASSAYATHQACNALRNGECDAAFVGASSISFSPNLWITLEKMGALSADGRSYSYDHKAAGFGRGEGGACLLIKRLDDAIKNGDPIHAVIRSSACNHCGRSEGITMPSRSAQEKLLRKVHVAAGLNPSETPVVEGHGTATPAGDPIEAGAFVSVLGKERTASNPLYIGSIKSNFGHLEGASGMLGIIKAILMVKYGTILPTAGFEKFNSRIEGQEKLVVAKEAIPWPKGEPRRALVTNFGFGGSNAAVLLEPAPSPAVDGLNGTAIVVSTSTAPHLSNVNGTDSTNGTDGTTGTNSTNGVATPGSSVANGSNGSALTPDMSPANGTNGIVTLEPFAAVNGTNGVHPPNKSRLFVLSAKAEKSLVAYLPAFKEYLDAAAPKFGSDKFAQDLSYTLGQRRTHHPYRISVVADSAVDLKEKLTAPPKSVRVRDRIVAFVFTGQGAQYAEMALRLHNYEAFAMALGQAEDHLRNMGASWSLTEELGKPASSSRINDAEISQPACTAVQLALVSLLKTWGVMPDRVTGHSSGEIAAAFAAGLISFRQAIATAYFRGQAAAQLVSRHRQGESQNKGAMLALGVGEDEASKLIEEHATDGYATVGAVNSPQSVTVSGDESAIEKIHQVAEARGLFVRRLKVGLAYHSRHMDEAATSYQEAIQPVYEEDSVFTGGPKEAPRPLFVSSVTGRVEATVDASYWVKNLVRPVKFTDAIQVLLLLQPEKTNDSTKLPNLVVEIGPHAALKNPIKQTVDALRQRTDRPSSLTSFLYLPSLVRGTDDTVALLNLAGGLFTAGVSSLQMGSVNNTDKHNADVLTDLPAYAWDKSASYQVISRNTRELLFPGEPYHPLLGRKMTSTGSNGERAYRQLFTLDEIPWIRDHNVGGAVIFPMTGYLSCAIEATRRAIAPSTVPAFVIRDFHVVRSLQIQEEQTVDIATKIRPTSTLGAPTVATNWTFEVSIWYEDTKTWATHAYGRIEPETAEMTLESPTLKESLPMISSSSLEECDPNLAYSGSDAGSKGTRYGPAFRSTVRYRKGDGVTVIDQKLRDLGKEKDLLSRFGSPYTADPPTLDGFLQGGGAFDVIDWKRQALMPNYVSRLRVSNAIPSTDAEQQRLSVVTKLLEYDAKGGRMLMSVAAFSQNPDGSLTPVAEWESVTFRSLVADSDEDSDPASALPENWRWEMIPRFEFLPHQDLTKRFLVGELTAEEIKHAENLHVAACYYIAKALKETAGDDRSSLPNHLSRFVTWAGRAVARESPPDLDIDSEPTALINAVRTRDSQGELLCAIGDVLTPILREQVQPLEVMLKDGLLTRHYEADVANALFSKTLGALVSNLADFEPNMRILEIGAGTAGTTLHVLNALSQDREDGAFLEYTFTDISPGFFENARHKLAKWTSRIQYEKLDISKDPVEQGFTAKNFDLIVAANVLHATPNMHATMTHVRSLLKPRGKLLLLEANRHAPLGLPFALLPGWWYAEDQYRDPEEGPLLTTKSWERLLVDTGFSGLDVLIEDRPGEPEQLLSIISSTRVGKRTDDTQITVCGPFMDDEEVEFAQQVADAISDRIGCQTAIKPFAEVDAQIDDPYCIFIDSPRQTILKDVSSRDTFEALQSLLVHNKGLLWIIPESDTPEVDIIKGMMRTVRLEYEPKHLLLLDKVPCGTAQGVNAAVQIAGILSDPEVPGGEDQDYYWHEGSIHQSRMRPLKEVKEQFAAEQGISLRSTQPIWGGYPLELTMDAAGTPEGIYFRRRKDVFPQGPLDANEIIVHVEAAGLNYRDLNLVFGSVPWASAGPPGFDGVGTVIAKGVGVRELQEGDRVLFLSLEGSAFATCKRMPSWHAFAKIPASISTTEEAASLPLAYSVAIAALMHTARLRKNETVLVHSAAGAVGQACIAIARHLGASRIFVTASTEAKRDFLHSALGIPKNQIFSSRTPQFRDAIMCATNGRGVDVIVNNSASLGERLLQETWELTAPFGRFVEINRNNLQSSSGLSTKPFERNVSFSSVDLRELHKHRPDALQAILSDFVRLLQSSDVIAPIKQVTAVPVSQFAEGLRKIKSGEHVGKVIVTLGKDERVLAESSLQPSQLQLDAEATYLVTGGTRGIGLSLAYWMIEEANAKNVVVIGRSGAKGDEAQQLLKKHDGVNGVRVRALACDVGDKEALASLLEEIKDELPPVRGVIHSALVLNDKLFQNATYEDWQAITTPRIQGAWNLHELLPDLSFFIALSSFLGDTGNAGQCIYAGTASFYDAFARHRNSLGLDTISISLPVVLGVGYVAANDLTSQLKQTLGGTLRIEDIITIVKSAIAGGPRSPFVSNDGKSTAFKLHVHGRPLSHIFWKYFHPVLLKHVLQADDPLNTKHVDGSGGGGGGAGGGVEDWRKADDPLAGLTEALITKVSNMTMIARDDVEADAPLANHGLDSLVSVELRNWIRRETGGVELALTTITQAVSLRALAAYILTQVEAK
ncbi:Type I Iterative PKS [Madurella fahalii]|uniref:Type I Iterative PKS n=1 Tax=Madurella fahalii TaxID=1157608 RepID=A0ABQ0GT55_9PEZI